jgi:Leucine-rich repeat (LRR) protein
LESRRKLSFVLNHFQIQLLVVLDLSNNDITTIDREAFCCVPNLQRLDLSSNPLHHLASDTFNGVRGHLQHLSVADAGLTLLPSFQLPRLKTLNVSANRDEHDSLNYLT